LATQSQVHGYTTSFWWTAGIFAAGAVICGALFRPGLMVQTDTPSPAQAEAPTAAQSPGGPGPNSPGMTRVDPVGLPSRESP
jgi:hypothetical protein